MLQPTYQFSYEFFYIGIKSTTMISMMLLQTKKLHFSNNFEINLTINFKI
jgi:hypothetical protein